MGILGVRSTPAKLIDNSGLHCFTADGTVLAFHGLVLSLPPTSIPILFPPSRGLSMMARRRAGFTLIELLIVVVIIGILAAMAIVAFGATKGKANFAAMRSDLHNLATAEEGFFYEHRAYTTRLDSLVFSTSHGVQLVINEATNAGWSATATHPESYPHLCSLYYGSAAPVVPATTDGVVACQ